MANNAHDAITALLTFVGKGRTLPPSSSELAQLQELDAEAFAACKQAGIPLSELPAERNLTPFGLMKIPSWRDSDGLNLFATANWQQAMRGSLALAKRAEPVESLGKQVEATAAEHRAFDADTPIGFLGGAALADALGIHVTRRDAFFRQLERKRIRLGDGCYHEVKNPPLNCPQFLYRVESPTLRALAARYKDAKPD